MPGGNWTQHPPARLTGSNSNTHATRRIRVLVSQSPFFGMQRPDRGSRSAKSAMLAQAECETPRLRKGMTKPHSSGEELRSSSQRRDPVAGDVSRNQQGHRNVSTLPIRWFQREPGRRALGYRATCTGGTAVECNLQCLRKRGARPPRIPEIRRPPPAPAFVGPERPPAS